MIREANIEVGYILGNTDLFYIFEININPYHMTQLTPNTDQERKEAAKKMRKSGVNFIIGITIVYIVAHYYYHWI